MCCALAGRLPFGLRISPTFLLLTGTVLVMGYLAIIPLYYLLGSSLWSSRPGLPGQLTIENYFRAFTSPFLSPLLYNSLLFAAGSTAVALVLATPLAWIFERTNTPFRRSLSIIALVPFIIPGVVHTMAWLLLLSPRVGLVNEFLKLVGFSPFNVNSMAGMIWIEGLHFAPLVFLMMVAAFRSMDPALEESARVAGSSVPETFLRITLRLMRPALLSATLLMFVRAIEGFEVPALVGLPSQIFVFTTMIWSAIRLDDFGLGASYAAIVLLITAIGTVLYRRATARTERFAVVTGRGFRPGVIDLGRWRYITLAFVLVYVFVGAVLPLFIMVWSSLLGFYTLPSLEALGNLTLNNYVTVLTGYSFTGRAIINSIILAIASATLVMLLTSVSSWITIRTHTPGRGLIDSLVFFPIAMPGIVVGSSLLIAYLSLANLGFNITGTLFVVLIAYLTRFIPYGLRYSSSSMIQLHKELEEAAKVCGSPWTKTFLRILLPLLKPGFLAGWIYVVMVSFRELSSSILLVRPGSEVVTVVLFDLWNSESFTITAAFGVILVAIMITLVLVAQRVGARVGIHE